LLSWVPAAAQPHTHRSASMTKVKKDELAASFQYQSPTFGTRVGIGSAATVGLLNRPQRKPLSRTESGILKINKINPAIAISTDERFVVSKDKGVE